MTRNYRKPNRATATSPDVTARTLVLAGIGALARGRRHAGIVVDETLADAQRLPLRGAEALVQARRSLGRAAARAESRLAPLRRDAEAFFRDAEREFEIVAAPLLHRLGATKPAARKASPRKRRARA